MRHNLRPRSAAFIQTLMIWGPGPNYFVRRRIDASGRIGVGVGHRAKLTPHLRA
jgi:hypothetical protein